MRPNNAVLDRITVPCAKMIYLATSNRGVLRLGPLPLRLGRDAGRHHGHERTTDAASRPDVGTKFGPPEDQLDVEVVVRLDSEPGRSSASSCAPTKVDPRTRGCSPCY